MDRCQNSMFLLDAVDAVSAPFAGRDAVEAYRAE
jgi:hypothetical protein